MAQCLHSPAIAVAPNGGRLTRADHPNVPITASELARTAATCREAGASMIHIHVRDRAGEHSLDADSYLQAIGAIRHEVGDGMLVQITTEALGRFTPDQQAAVVRAVRPEAASLALRELVSANGDTRFFIELIHWMDEAKVLPQIILYSPAEALQLHSMLKLGVLPFNSIPVLYVLGRYSRGQKSCPADLLPYLNQDVGFGHWMTCAFGKRELSCVLTGALLGGHVRVGFENNIYRPDGSVGVSNAEAVSAVASALQGAGLAIATAAMLREQLWRSVQESPQIAGLLSSIGKE